MARKSRDPTLIALLDQQRKAIEAFERWYARCKRAFTRMDKIKKKLARLGKKIEAHQAASGGT